MVREIKRLSLRTLFGAMMLVAVAGSRTLHADYRAEFRNGVRAYNKGRWSETADSMRKAIAESGRESAERINISGTWYVAYMPHFYLGVALAKLGRCDEARPELAASEAQGIVQKFEYATLRVTRDGCGLAPQPQPLTASSTPVKPLTEPPSRTPIATATIATDTRAPQPVAPPLTASSAGVTPAPQPVGPQSVPSALPAGDALTASKRSLQSNVDDVRRLLAANQSSTPRARDARTKLSNALATASRALTSSSPATIALASNSLTASLNDYRGALGSLPPRTLADAINAYAGGDYGRAIKLLDGTNASDGVYRGQIALFRAAARYSQYVMAGERDGGLKRRVEDDVLAFRGIDPNRPLDPRLFSPKFLSFVARTVRSRS